MILAIAPVVLIPIALVVASGFAWLKLRKGSTGAATSPAIDPTLPTLKMSAGGSTAELYRNGPVWAFKVEGAVPATATDPNAGKAAVDMAQSFAASIANAPDAPILGAASSPTNDPLEFSIEKTEDIWTWSVTREAAAKVPGVPAVPTLVAGDGAETRSRAVLQVLSVLSANLDWLEHVPAAEGGGAPIPEPTRLPGIVVSGKTLAVTNLAAWITHVAPVIREQIADGLTAEQMLDELQVSTGIPNDGKINGKTTATVEDSVRKALDAIRGGTYLDVDPPDETIAALLVGANIQANLRHNDWWVGKYKGHVIVARPAKAPGGGGFGANLGDRWQYLIWVGNARGYDTAVAEQKIMDAGKKKNAAIRAAKDRIDAGMPGFDGVNTDAGTVFGAVVVPEAKVVCGYGEWLNPATGKCEKLEDLELADTIERELSAPWTSASKIEIVLFDFATGNYRTRRDWTLAIGVCLEARGDTPYGSLTSALEGEAPVQGSPFGDPLARFQIREAPKPGTIGGSGSAVENWDSFRSPVAFREQFQMKFERGPMVMSQQAKAMVPTVKVTKAPAPKANDALDPCDGTTHWPLPKRDAGFIVEKAAASWQAWKPEPKVQIYTSGTRVMLRITAAGLPVFADAEGAPSPALDFATTYNVTVKLQITGMNP